MDHKQMNAWDDSVAGGTQVLYCGADGFANYKSSMHAACMH